MLGNRSTAAAAHGRLRGKRDNQSNEMANDETLRNHDDPEILSFYGKLKLILDYWPILKMVSDLFVQNCPIRPKVSNVFKSFQFVQNIPIYPNFSNLSKVFKCVQNFPILSKIFQFV